MQSFFSAERLHARYIRSVKLYEEQQLKLKEWLSTRGCEYDIVVPMFSKSSIIDDQIIHISQKKSCL